MLILKLCRLHPNRYGYLVFAGGNRWGRVAAATGRPRVATSGDPHEGYRWQVRIRDAEWGLISQKAVARILIAGPKADGRGQRIREEPETNPIELTCFLSTT